MGTAIEALSVMENQLLGTKEQKREWSAGHA